MSETTDNEIINGEVYRYLAKEIAKLLNGKGSIKRVGLFGSTAKGKENPNDIDLALFIDDNCAQDSLIHYYYELTGETDPQETAWNEEMKSRGIKPANGEYQTSQFLGLSIIDGIRFLSTKKQLAEAGILVNEIYISDNPSQEYLDMAIEFGFRDPNFLVDLSNEALIFNSESDAFEKTTVFKEEALELIRQQSHERLREIVDGKHEDYLNCIEQNPRHKV